MVIEMRTPVGLASIVPAMALGVAASLTDHGVGITELAPEVEAAGLESLFLVGHSHVPVGRHDLLEDPFHAKHRRLLDQFTALGTAAGVTSTLRLGTGVCVVAQHNPILLAKQVATLDHISGGRFLFGVGAGWLVEELHNFGVDPQQRWDVMAEHIRAMKEIWTCEAAEFHGRFVDFDPIWMWPKPVQSPYPPMLVGGSGSRSLRVAAEHGDGWLPVVEDLQEFDAQRAELVRSCDHAGRGTPEVTACLNDLEESLVVGCLERGVTRCVILAPTEDREAFRSFLATCSRLREHLV
jgi:probable F420-dependent oxidoreductase